MPYKIMFPSPMPADGRRQLTLRELAQRARALTDYNFPDPCQCQGQVYVNLFFDGTGNNKDWAEPGLGGTQTDANKHSNVARLYNARRDDLEQGYFSYYVPGIGTPFREIGDPGSDWSKATGYRGADRINWGITRVFNAVHAYLTKFPLLDDERAKSLVIEMSRSQYLDREVHVRRRKLKELEAQLENVVTRHQCKLTHIHIAVFGFSRGAALARAFAHWMLDIAQQKDGTHRLAGVPLRISFMGLFDTVASVGTPGGNHAWAADTMQIHPAVAQCEHFVALHEQRAYFPLTLARNVTHVGYPGMHSDVGGGYRPGEQGRAMPAWGVSPHLSQVPLIDMHHAAFKAGVPLLSIGEIHSKHPRVKDDFAISPNLVAAVNDYYLHCGIATAAAGEAGVRAVIEAHTLQYLQWRAGCMFQAQHYSRRRFYQQAQRNGEQGQLLAGMSAFDLSHNAARMRLAEREAALRNPRSAASGGIDDVASYGEMLRSVERDKRVVAALANWRSLPQPVGRLMDDYVHDSLAPFLGLERPFASNYYLGFRELQRDVPAPAKGFVEALQKTRAAS